MKTKNNIKNKWKSCSIKLSLHDYNEITELIEKGKYLNHSDFIRYVIKNELRKQNNGDN